MTWVTTVLSDASDGGEEEEEEEENSDDEMGDKTDEKGDGAADKVWFSTSTVTTESWSFQTLICEFVVQDSEDEEVGNLQLAWEMLEVAKVIYIR